MATIVMTQSVIIRDARIREIADGIVGAASLALHRAVANSSDRNKFPIPQDPNTLEQAFGGLLSALPTEQQNRARARVVPAVDRQMPTIARLSLSQPVSSAEFRASTPAENLVLPRAISMRSRLTSGDLGGWSSMFSGQMVRVVMPSTGSNARVVPNVLEPALTPEQQVEQKYKALGGAQGFLGAPTGGFGTTPGGVGHFRHYAGGSIYFTSWTGAHEVHGAIREEWKSLGWEQSALHFPTTDERKTPDGIGRYNHFEDGSIYWSPPTGAHALYGPIHEKWKSLGWEKSVLGYPTTGVLATPDGIGRYAHFEHGSIYFTPQTGAHEVHGAIHEFWKAQGWEQGPLGYPLTDELDMPEGRRSVFQNGTVGWTATAGAFHATTAPISKLGLRLLKLHCIDETGKPAFGGEIGADDIQIGGVATSAYGESSPFGPKALGGYNDGTWSDWSPFILHSFEVNQNDGVWPKGFIATMILVEKDHGGYSDFVKKVMTKTEEIVKSEVAKQAGVAVGTLVGAAAGGPLGAAVGAIAGLVAAYVIEKIFDLFKDIFADDIFYPITVHAQLPAPGALFAHNTYDSEDGYCWVKGHNGHYEWWYDWMVA